MIALIRSRWIDVDGALFVDLLPGLIRSTPVGGPHWPVAGDECILAVEAASEYFDAARAAGLEVAT